MFRVRRIRLRKLNRVYEGSWIRRKSIYAAFHEGTVPSQCVPQSNTEGCFESVRGTAMILRTCNETTLQG